MEPYEEHFIKIASYLGNEPTIFPVTGAKPTSAYELEPGSESISGSYPVSVTIEQLAGVWNCTSRNVKIILRRLEELGYIRWEAGRGRGHKSKLQFIRSSHDVLAGAFRRELTKGHIKEAIDLLGRPEICERQKEQLWAALYAEMGISSQRTAAGGTDAMQMIRYRAPGSLDPAFVFTAFEAYILGQVCSTLVRYEVSGSQGSAFEPGLSHLWEANPDFTRWTFYLRKGVKFHNGKVLTARDVKFTVERLETIGSPGLWAFKELERIEIHGDHALSFVFRRPNRFMLHLAGSFPMSIVPEGSEPEERLIGTGPFRIGSLTPDSLQLHAFDDYYGYRPLLDEVTIWFFPDMASSERHYQVSSADNPEELLSRPLPTGICPEYRAAGCKYLLFNFNKEGPQHLAAFRQVLRCVYNPEVLLEELGGSRLSPAASFLPWKSKHEQFSRDSLDEARELLKASGYEGQEIRLAFKNMKEEEEEAAWIRRRCDSLGIPISFVPYKDMDFASLLNKAELILAEESIEEDWEWGMINFFLSGHNSISLFMTAEQIATIEGILSGYMEHAEGERHLLLDRVEQLFRDRDWLLYGCHMNKKAFYDQGLQGLQTTSFGFLDFSKLWIKSPGGMSEP
ncbi:ABC transporter substrate-binding protein [Paenibacillus physcomitrellae]|uniref:ABC transporter substrate-binding protein n=1 Tax=Paenibacillus physcomitrellae TaxID=1619311 RepID=A0ABQ1FPQ4_9BACL|nr:ABC transporter substrate-binding protein [Paenibacillus physcomitrellae]GGA25407.1 ABC transporter substrate-binding protein [Paenibacillus physcomitrellae]